MGHKNMMAPKPFVELGGNNIAPYLYGDAARIFGQKRTGLTIEELRSIHRQVSQQGSGSALFGVCLKTIRDPRIIQAGDRILHVNDAGNKTLFRIERLESADGRGCPMLYTKTLLPNHSKDFQGFFPANHTVIPERDYDLSDYGIYFLYLETAEHRQREKQPSFCERVMEMANQLSVLIECWSIAHAPAGTLDDAWSHDSFTMYWGPEFHKKYGNRFEHVNVDLTLENIVQGGDLRGISRIYNDRNKTCLGQPVVDKITPLMEQMQNDILQRLLEDDTLFGRIFPEKASRYWKRRLQVIVEMFNAPRGLVVSERKTDNTTHQSFRNLQDLDPKKQRQLASIIHIIERQDTEEGLKECARAVYQRIMGRPYERNDNRVYAV